MPASRGRGTDPGRTASTIPRWPPGRRRPAPRDLPAPVRVGLGLEQLPGAVADQHVQRGPDQREGHGGGCHGGLANERYHAESGSVPGPPRGPRLSAPAAASARVRTPLTAGRRRFRVRPGTRAGRATSCSPPTGRRGGRLPGLQPVGGRPALGGCHQLERRGAVEVLADDVGVARVPGGLLDQVQQHPAHRPGVDVVGEPRGRPRGTGTGWPRSRSRPGPRRSRGRPPRSRRAARPASRPAPSGSRRRSRRHPRPRARVAASRCPSSCARSAATCLIRPPTLRCCCGRRRPGLLVGQAVGGDAAARAAAGRDRRAGRRARRQRGARFRASSGPFVWWCTTGCDPIVTPTGDKVRWSPEGQATQT